MPTSWLNSKKCSRPERARLRPAAVALAARALLPLTALALPAAPSAASELKQSIERDLLDRRQPAFGALLRHWQEEHGPRAVEPLAQIAIDRKRADRDRYVTAMAALKLGGPAVATRLAPLLKDRSWMLRSAALNAFTVAGDARAGARVLPLLRDPALVVRSEAVRAVRALRPAGGAAALVAALRDEKNYHRGRALWVPHEILDALVALEAREQASALRPLLRHDRDPELLRRTIATLSALTGKSPAADRPLREQARAWEKTL
jgi:HEAT repeat protein